MIRPPRFRAAGARPARLLGALACVLALVGCSGAESGTDGSASPTPRPTTSAVATPTTSSPSHSTTRETTPSPSTSTPTPPSQSPTRSRPPTSAPGPSDPDCPADLTLPQQVGQLFMMGVSATGPTQAQLKAIGDTHVGAAVFVGNSNASISRVKDYTGEMREAASQPDGVGLMVAADQEGGLVQRLSGQGFSDIPPAEVQATYSDATLRAKAETWGQQLREAGVTVNLAPVADVVPASVGDENKPIGALDRGYGSDPKQVADKVTAFIKGMAAAGEGTTVKHFPGLGTVTGNTDFADHVVDTTTTRGSDLLAGFDAAIAAGADMVMISTAYYAEIDPDHPAAFSREVITGMLREDRSYDGVVISDDLGAAKAVSDWPPGRRAILFLQAGGDLVINVDPATTHDMIDAVIAKAEQDPGFADRVAQSARRVLELKAQLGLNNCG